MANLLTCTPPPRSQLSVDRDFILFMYSQLNDEPEITVGIYNLKMKIFRTSGKGKTTMMVRHHYHLRNYHRHANRKRPLPPQEGLAMSKKNWCHLDTCRRAHDGFVTSR